MDFLLDRGMLIRNLCFMYRLMVASAPLLEFAIERSDGVLRDYYKKHLEEETGHDEMLLSDLKELGVLQVPYDYSAAQLAGSQYYFIAHQHPSMLLGYMEVLESKPLPMSLIEEVEKRHGCGMSALRLHSEHDPYHSEDIKKIRSLLTEELNAAIEWNKQGVEETLKAEFARWAHA